MPSFSKRSRNNLNSCHRDLIIIFNTVIRYFDCTILCGYRNEEHQNECFKKGTSKVKYPHSKHNSKPSMAVDTYVYPIEWENVERQIFFIGRVLGIANLLHAQGIIEYNLKSGIDWDNDTFLKDNNFDDLPHFELFKPKR